MLVGCFPFDLRMIEGCGDPDPTSIRTIGAARNIYRSEEGSKGGHGGQL